MLKRLFDLGRKELKKLEKIADNVFALAEEYKQLSDEELKAKTDRRSPELKVGSKVKIMLKYSKGKKGTYPLYSDTKYEIERIEEK
jgi:preprotein translocase subunit SecA